VAQDKTVGQIKPNT